MHTSEPPFFSSCSIAEKCDIPYFGEVACYDSYDMINEDDSDYCIGWKSPPCAPEEKVYKYTSPAWQHTKAIDVWGLPTSGLFTTYSGGGYMAKLDVNLQISINILDELYKSFWINRETRSVIFEFTLYCANMNLYAYNMFIVEFPETGGAIPYYVIMPLRLHHHVGSRGSYVLFCEIIFVIFVIAHGIKVFWRIYKQKKQFFKEVWNTLDFIWFIGCIIAMVMYFIRYVAANDTMDGYLEDHKAFVNFQHIATGDFVFNLVIAMLVFQATIHLLYVMGYNQRMSTLVKVFTLCAADLFWYGLFFIYLLMGYAFLGWLLFGSTLGDYMDIISTLETLFISMIGKSRFNEMKVTHPGLAQVYFFAFVLTMVFTLLTIFMAILCESINTVHERMKIAKSEELMDYLMNKVKKLIGIDGKKSSTDIGK